MGRVAPGVVIGPHFVAELASLRGVGKGNCSYDSQSCKKEDPCENSLFHPVGENEEYGEQDKED